jgi:hypothetical protein
MKTKLVLGKPVKSIGSMLDTIWFSVYRSVDRSVWFSVRGSVWTQINDSMIWEIEL